MEDFVTYEQAVKLKELGFDWECSNNTIKYSGVETPTLAQVQKWLREKEIFLFISNDNDAEVNGRTQFHWWIADKLGRPFLYGESNDVKLLRCESYYDTYEQSLSAGINKALEILKEEKP